MANDSKLATVITKRRTTFSRKTRCWMDRGPRLHHRRQTRNSDEWFHAGLRNLHVRVDGAPKVVPHRAVLDLS